MAPGSHPRRPSPRRGDVMVRFNSGFSGDASIFFSTNTFYPYACPSSHPPFPRYVQDANSAAGDFVLQRISDMLDASARPDPPPPALPLVRAFFGPGGAEGAIQEAVRAVLRAGPACPPLTGTASAAAGAATDAANSGGGSSDPEMSEAEFQRMRDRFMESVTSLEVAEGVQSPRYGSFLVY